MTGRWWPRSVEGPVTTDEDTWVPYIEARYVNDPVTLRRIAWDNMLHLARTAQDPEQREKDSEA